MLRVGCFEKSSKSSRSHCWALKKKGRVLIMIRQEVENCKSGGTGDKSQP